MKHIRSGNTVIDTQLSAGYQSSSGFRDAFARIMGSLPTASQQSAFLHASWLDTPLGPMLAVADEEKLIVLEFVDRRGLEREIERLRKKCKAAIIPGETTPIHSIKKELALYFQGKLKHFETPLRLIGSEFQQAVWHALMKIPYGETCSYAGLAKTIGKPTAFRAVANANGANQIAIVIPCHRVINTNGGVGGYGGGVPRKEWLLSHEKTDQGKT